MNITRHVFLALVLAACASAKNMTKPMDYDDSDTDSISTADTSNLELQTSAPEIFSQADLSGQSQAVASNDFLNLKVPADTPVPPYQPVDAGLPSQEIADRHKAHDLFESLEAKTFNEMEKGRAIETLPVDKLKSLAEAQLQTLSPNQAKKAYFRLKHGFAQSPYSQSLIDLLLELRKIAQLSSEDFDSDSQPISNLELELFLRLHPSEVSMYRFDHLERSLKSGRGISPEAAKHALDLILPGIFTYAAQNKISLIQTLRNKAQIPYPEFAIPESAFAELAQGHMDFKTASNILRVFDMQPHEAKKLLEIFESKKALIPEYHLKDFLNFESDLKALANGHRKSHASSYDLSGHPLLSYSPAL